MPGAEPTVIRDNRFIDVYHAIGINGGGVHFLDNRIYTEQPHRVPTSTHPGDALNISPAGGKGDHRSCSDNVVIGNRIEGHTHGIRIGLYALDTSCRRNVIRGNTIAETRVPWSDANGAGIWVSPGSEHNEIAGNSFDDIAAAAVVLEGDSNRVVLSEGDAVRDSGIGNDVIIRTGDTERATPYAEPAGLAASQQSALADTIRSLEVESMTLWNRLDPDAWLALFGDSVRWYYHATSLDRAEQCGTMMRTVPRRFLLVAPHRRPAEPTEVSCSLRP
jgi:hypothetical protein